MKLSTLALAGFAALTPVSAAAQAPLSQAELDKASASFCAGIPDKVDCVQHLSDAQYAQMAKNVVVNRCASIAKDAASLAKKGNLQVAFTRRLDAADCAFGILRVTEDQVLQNEAQAWGIQQRAAASGIKPR